MRLMKPLVLAIAAVTVLSGCKNELVIDIDPSEKATDAVVNSVRQATLSVEVTSCTDSDTGLDSKTLLEAKQKIPYVFKGATFEKCSRVQYDDVAVFSVPVTYFPKDQKCDDDSICTFIAAETNGRANMVLSAGKNVIKKYQKLQSNSGLSSGSDNKLVLRVKNSMKTAIDAKMGAFIIKNQETKIPIYGDLVATIPPDNMGLFQLPDVASETLLYHGRVVVGEFVYKSK